MARRRVRRVRLGAVTAALAGTLVLSACSDDGGSEDDAYPSTSPTPSATAPSATGGATTAPAGGLEGSWLTTADGDAVALVVTGEQAALFGSKGSVCSGTARSGSIRLTCADGDDQRTSGTVDSVDGSTLKVTWSGGTRETYQRAEGGKLPTGLPTAGLGQ
ncbi:hypothetical protein [Streptomyces sp. enrichment culture]|uniref:hypothetical protein n=1 Tax=Streptomyces sp. enrichment culture TaxID=1795815 RepID=UPI003F5590B6